MPPASVSAVEFLRAIWGEGPGQAELCGIIKGKPLRSDAWTYPSSIDSFVKTAARLNQEYNAYMGVCLKKEKWPRKTGKFDSTGKEIEDFRGTEENALSSMVVWCEFDFLNPENAQGHKGRVIDPDTAKKWLAEFPRKPSIIVKSGGGIQCYWLLKEPAVEKDLWRVKAINKALVVLFTVERDGRKYGADTQSVDLARVLRIPGTKNLKYTPHRPCEISWWHPENAYLLDDFDFLPTEDLMPSLQFPPSSLPQSPSPPQPSHASPGSAPAPAPAHAHAHTHPAEARVIPNIDLPEDVVAEIGTLLGEMWFEGHRHQMALCVAGMLVNRAVSFKSAREIVTRASNIAGGDTEHRLKDVKDTYEKWNQNKEVTGATTLENIINQDFPKMMRDKAKKTVEKIKDLLPKKKDPNGGDDDGKEKEIQPNFDVVPPLIKFDSRPARWGVTLRMHEGEKKELQATVETPVLTKFQSFSDAFLEQTNELLLDIRQTRWKSMLRGLPIEVRETPKEAKPEGAIETAIEEFLDEAKENPDVGMLKAFPGYDEEARFFKYQAFDNFLKNQGQKFERRVVYDHLKNMGFAQKTRRFGPTTAKVWSRIISEGGGTNGNGHGHPPEPPDSGPSSPTPGPGRPKTSKEPEKHPEPVAVVTDDLFKGDPDEPISEPGERG